MVIARLAQSQSEVLEVKKGMPKLGSSNPLVVYGYWEEDRCIGGSYLMREFPHHLVMEFYPPAGVSIVKAIRDSFKGLFKVKPVLTAQVAIDNHKSLKMIKQLGFYKIYLADNQFTVEISPQTWRYQKRYPL